MRFAPEALPFVLPFALASAALLSLQQAGWAALTAVLALALLLFFRIPRRSGSPDPEAVLAPANGKVTQVELVEDAELGEGRFHRIVTFLSVFDVHVQRAPVAGQVIACRYRRGRKVAAFRAHAGEVNECMLTVFRCPNGDVVAVRQIAGLLARRVVCKLTEGRSVQRGELMGLIKFGSRVDLLMPEAYELGVSVGDRLREGASVVAHAAAPDTSSEVDRS